MREMRIPIVPASLVISQDDATLLKNCAHNCDIKSINLIAF